MNQHIFLYITKYNPLTKNIKGTTQTSLYDKNGEIPRNKLEQLKKGNLIINESSSKKISAISTNELTKNQLTNEKLNFKDVKGKGRPGFVNKTTRNKVHRRINERKKEK